jgi:hypothetical protein
VHVALVVGSAEHSSVEEAPRKLRRNGHAAPLAGDGGAHDDLRKRGVLDEDTAVVALEHVVNIPVATSKIKALRRNAVGRAQGGAEHDPLVLVLEDAEYGRLPVVDAELAGEFGVGDEP